MFCPPERNVGKRSIIVTLKPARESQYAVMGPAIEAPTTSAWGLDIVNDLWGVKGYMEKDKLF
jgi:hypothetical protein